ncbi:MAG: serine hydrolase domain-containing protein [Candidatus Thorarchaeota archaeon]
MISYKTILTFSLIVALTLSMSNHQYAISQSSNRDYWPTDEWRVVTPEIQGMNSSLLNDMLSRVDDLNLDIDSVSIIRNGYLVFHELPSGNYDGTAMHVLASVAKSVSSVLVGIAIDLGYISNLSQRVIDFFPDRTIDNMDGRKENWTLEHLLTMTSGLEWDEVSYSYESSLNSYSQLTQSEDWIQFMLDLPMETEPGTSWTYNSGSVFLISPIIESLTNMTLGEFAEEYLFRPLGITNYYWEQNPNGFYIANGHFGLATLDLAKIGFMLLNNGTWENNQIISSDWIQESKRTRHFFSDDRGYGYLWWTLPDIDVYYALGAYNQHLFISPDHDLVVSITASIAGNNPVLSLFRNYILPSIIGPIQSIPFFLSPTVTLLVIVAIGSVIGVAVVAFFRKKG